MNFLFNFHLFITEYMFFVLLSASCSSRCVSNNTENIFGTSIILYNAYLKLPLSHIEGMSFWLYCRLESNTRSEVRRRVEGRRFDCEWVKIEAVEFSRGFLRKDKRIKWTLLEISRKPNALCWDSAAQQVASIFLSIFCWQKRENLGDSNRKNKQCLTCWIFGTDSRPFSERH